MELKINHVAFTVNSIEESINWYKTTLGFTFLDEYQNADMKIARIKLDNVILELFNFGPNTKSMPNYHGDLTSDLQTVGTKHLCIQVPDLEKILPLLQSNAVEIVGQPDAAYFGGKYIFIKDCNGILIELYQQ